MSTYTQTINDPAEGQLDIHEFRRYEIHVDGQLAENVFESPWDIASEYRRGGMGREQSDNVQVIWHLRREYRNADGEIVRTETHTKDVTR